MSEPEELTCRELVELVTDYLEDALPGHERARFEAHLSMCAGCTSYLDQIRTTIRVAGTISEETIRVAGTISEETIPEEAKEQLLTVFRFWKSG